jgi:hypothetical protein
LKSRASCKYAPVKAVREDFVHKGCLPKEDNHLDILGPNCSDQSVFGGVVVVVKVDTLRMSNLKAWCVIRSRGDARGVGGRLQIVNVRWVRTVENVEEAGTVAIHFVADQPYSCPSEVELWRAKRVRKGCNPTNKG